MPVLVRGLRDVVQDLCVGGHVEARRDFLYDNRFHGRGVEERARTFEGLGEVLGWFIRRVTKQECILPGPLLHDPWDARAGWG